MRGGVNSNRVQHRVPLSIHIFDFTLEKVKLLKCFSNSLNK